MPNQSDTNWCSYWRGTTVRRIGVILCTFSDWPLYGEKDDKPQFWRSGGTGRISSFAHGEVRWSSGSSSQRSDFATNAGVLTFAIVSNMALIGVPEDDDKMYVGCSVQGRVPDRVIRPALYYVNVQTGRLGGIVGCKVFEPPPLPPAAHPRLPL